MSIGAVFQRWLAVLAALAVGLRERWRARRVLVVARDGDGFVFRRDAAAGNEVLGSAPAGAKAPEAVLEAARDGAVVLELPRDKVLHERLGVPRQAREFVPGIVRNQIERLSPWKADQAVYGFAVEESRDDGAALDVSVSITSRAVVDAARDEVAAAGLSVDRVVAPASPDAAGGAVVLWSRVEDAPGESLKRARWAIAAGVAACVAASAALTAWATASGAAMRAESEELSARIKSLQRQVQGARSAVSRAALNPLEKAWSVKASAPAAIVTLEAVSRFLPDSAYLNELTIEGPTLRMIGLAADAPSLIAPLEASGHLAEVRFFAPTTRSADENLFRFHIEARVQPRLEVASP
ncbi:MAG: PilN domain-containing protein [Microvirga sp.]